MNYEVHRMNAIFKKEVSIGFYVRAVPRRGTPDWEPVAISPQ